MEKINEDLWEAPATGRMNVPVRIYADHELLLHIEQENVLQQALNVACLPGIVKASLAMPDAHWGYGFPIGGVAAFDPDAGGVISPGGIGYDINCGVRMIRTDLAADAVRGRIAALVEALYSTVPTGIGAGGGVKTLSDDALRDVMLHGARWAVENGWGCDEDVRRTEDGGALTPADPDAVGPRARERGRTQLGTLGGGNHFLEIDVVEEVYDNDAARTFGVETGLCVIQIHSGSRGFGHQICSDALNVMQRAAVRYGIELPDRQLACAPLNSPEGRSYYGAMAAAANYAWCNRQILQALALKAVRRVFDADPDRLGCRLIYDVCHNIARFENHHDRGRDLRLCVHRKGATRAFGPGRPEVPEPYRTLGQPVLIPGDMGTGSYLLAGTAAAMEQTWGSTCHGAGRIMSRKKALARGRGRDLRRDMHGRGVTVRARGTTTLAEEMPGAYKNVDRVVDVVHRAGLARKIARLRPIGVIKG